jgi:hypothetical protein
MRLAALLLATKLEGAAGVTVPSAVLIALRLS